MKIQKLNEGRITDLYKEKVKREFENEIDSTDISHEIADDGLSFTIVRADGAKLLFTPSEGYTTTEPQNESKSIRTLGAKGKKLDETITEDKPIKKSLKYSQEAYDKTYAFLKDATDNFTKEGRFKLPDGTSGDAAEDILADHYERSGLTGDSENPTYPEEVRAYKPYAREHNLSDESLSESIDFTFKVGDTFEYSGLYGGTQHCKVINVTDNAIECKVNWTSEDDGKGVSDTTTFKLDTDSEGNQCAIVWEYNGEVGRVYPPSMHEETLLEANLRNEKGEVMADKWYASQYPDDKLGIKQLKGITLDAALKDRSILDNCDAQVKERVYVQLDKYIPLSKESPMYKEVNEAYEVSDEDAIRDWAKDCKEMGYGVEDYKEFASILKDEGIVPTQELYQIYLDSYNSSNINESVEMPYMFHYNCNNPTYGYDFQQFASKLGAKKVYGKWQGKGQGRYFYLVPSEDVYNELKAVAKDKYTIDMQKMLPYSEEDYPKVQVMNEAADNVHSIRPGDTLESKSGHKIHIKDIVAQISPFEKQALVTFEYDYEKTDGEKGSSSCSAHDLKAMLMESVLKEDYSDDIITLSRYLDMEVPTACENMLELIENLPTNKVNFLTNVCRAFIEKLNRTIEYYTMTGDDFDESLSEASYGGAFDIADDHYFTREDLDSFSEEVLNHINETFKAQFDVASCYIDNGVLEIGVTNDEYGDYIHSEKIDMRKIKEPWHLKKVYAFDFATNLINDIVQTNDGLIEWLNESMTDAQPIEAGAAVGMASVINDLIKDEYEAIDGYNSAIATAQAEGFGDAVKLLTDIQAEENLHVGQLQEVMKLFDPNADKVEDGQAEGAEQLANPLGDDDLSDLEFTEALNSMDRILEDINKSTEIPNNNIEDINLDELEEEVVVDMQEAWEDIYKSFKDIETQLNGDGEAITATIDRLRDENKGNPDFEKAYDKWASGN